MDKTRSSTPPRQAAKPNAILPNPPLTPEQVRKIELNRLKAKAIREQREAEERKQNDSTTLNRSESSVAGQKRAFSSISKYDVPSNSRDARNEKDSLRPLDQIRPAKNFAKYVEYEFSKMTDTKGGFMTAEDDPHNKALHTPGLDEKPAHMTMKEWERHQLLKSLERRKAGPYEPGLSVLKKDELKKCRECGSFEIDYKWEEIFHCAVCNACKEKVPEKYSLLTKTEAREDYLLTEPELKDEELLPHLERPNPHKATWNNMMLFLRYQVEEYAFSKKWGSADKLDEEYTRRENEKKRRKEAKFKSKLEDLKKKTRFEAYRRSRKGEATNEVGKSTRHNHQWGRAVEDAETGMSVKTCIECGMEVEELEF
ncbi:MAG: hypothetical protein M1834_008062 [Cirrosporium novae-zelandiae]|nr:MAG: hypothetical protein M1834_005841 [Cirrosporium novae-zelandiae]KAI9738558.1 MAG: hypothetical protein M1834_008062 [Cirrosporium novae-zelandiae]